MPAGTETAWKSNKARGLRTTWLQQSAACPELPCKLPCASQRLQSRLTWTAASLSLIIPPQAAQSATTACHSHQARPDCPVKLTSR